MCGFACLLQPHKTLENAKGINPVDAKGLVVSANAIARVYSDVAILFVRLQRSLGFVPFVLEINQDVLQTFNDPP